MKLGLSIGYWGAGPPDGAVELVELDQHPAVDQVELDEAAHAARSSPTGHAPPPDPEQVSVPVIPSSVTDSLAELAARAEALALELEEDDSQG